MKFLLFSFFLSLPFNGFASGVKEDDASASTGGLVTVKNPLFRPSSPLEVYNALKGEVPETIILNPLYQDRALRKGTPEERRLVNNRTNHPCFLDAAQSYGLNLDEIDLRRELRRKYSSDGDDFSNLVSMVRGTLYKISQKKLELEAQDKGAKARIAELEDSIALYEKTIKKSLLTISRATGVPVEVLGNIPPLEPVSACDQAN